MIYKINQDKKGAIEFDELAKLIIGIILLIILIVIVTVVIRGEFVIQADEIKEIFRFT